MNTPHSYSSLFSQLELAPKDPILGVTEAFVADINPKKTNLGVGIYYDEAGKIPLLECVKQATEALTAQNAPHPYLPIDGLANYSKAVQPLLFGAKHPILSNGRIVTVQSLGGTGALKLAADFLKRFSSTAHVWISDPSWENHRLLFEYAGFQVHNYPYYDSQIGGINFPVLIDTLSQIAPQSILVLHGCCHNPTGSDLTPAHWQEIIKIIKTKQLIPIIDIAYQGFDKGLVEDAAALGWLYDAEIPFLVANSFSKSFSLYGERVGALSLITSTSDEAGRALSQLKRVIRTNYSKPPTYGGHIVATVLNTPTLRNLWEQELGAMRTRIAKMRVALAEGLRQQGSRLDTTRLERQRGMFSYSGLSQQQVLKLRSDYGIYALETGRICVAALNQNNLSYVVEAITKVTQ